MNTIIRLRLESKSDLINIIIVLTCQCMEPRPLIKKTPIKLIIIGTMQYLSMFQYIYNYIASLDMQV